MNFNNSNQASVYKTVACGSLEMYLAEINEKYNSNFTFASSLKSQMTQPTKQVEIPPGSLAAPSCKREN